ncbi:MAG TPA: CPBP family intramembrane glutamic endopeptidase [Acidimicrobiales bacterium]|nr:CPBP family intramembrane glutamic endopeptidase [Acidimicrobiales bacterium]
MTVGSTDSLTAATGPASAPSSSARGGRVGVAGGWVVLVAGSVVLTARPALVSATPAPVVTLVLLFGALLVVGATWPLAPSTESAPRLGTTAAVLVGLSAFALGRVVGGGHAPLAPTVAIVVTNTLAAVAEEAFFRRLCFGLLAPAGVVWAVVGSAVLFAVVHVTSYGWWVLPLDLAAGFVLGWQRAVTGSWRAPAVTHVLVNLLMVF